MNRAGSVVHCEIASAVDTPISTVQIQTDEGLYDVQGPAQE